MSKILIACVAGLAPEPDRRCGVGRLPEGRRRRRELLPARRGVLLPRLAVLRRGRLLPARRGVLLPRLALLRRVGPVLRSGRVLLLPAEGVLHRGGEVTKDSVQCSVFSEYSERGSIVAPDSVFT